MAKPTQIPTWATDTNYPSGTDPWASSVNKVEMTAGKKAQGWLPEEPPPAQYMNWWKNLVGQWTQYVSDTITMITRSQMFTPILPLTNWSWNAGGGGLFYLESTGSAVNVTSLPIRQGEKLTAVSITVFGNGTADCDYWLSVVNSVAATNVLQNPQDTNRSAAWATFNFSFSPYTFAAGDSLTLQASPNASGYRVSNVRWTCERP